MNIRPRGDRTWQLTWQAGRDPVSGKWKRVTETFHGTEKQAQQRWLQRQPEIERGTGVELHGITFGALWQRWLAMKAKTVRPRTLDSYRQLGDQHILPLLRDHRVEKLRPLDIQSIVLAWQEPSARLDHKKKDETLLSLSPRTVRYLRQLVVSVLDQAVKWQVIPTNPARAVDPPKTEKPVRVWWTLEQGQQFLASATGHRYAVALGLALGVGLRMGEILGLRWRDIDWEGGTLTVAQTQTLVREGDHQVMHFGPPKTAESRRTVPLDQGLLRALKWHRTNQQRERDLVKGAYEDHGLVLQTALGRPVHPRNLSRTFDLLQEKAAVPRIRFHDLRHTHASWLLERGVNMRTIADRLGHSQVSFTMQVYAHSRVEHQREAAEALGAALWQNPDGVRRPSEK